VQVWENCFGGAAAAQVSLGNNFHELLADRWSIINFTHARGAFGKTIGSGTSQNNFTKTSMSRGS